MSLGLKYFLMTVMVIALSGCSYFRDKSFDDIYQAASNDDTSTLIDVLESGESLNVLNDDNMTPLCYAYMQNNETAIRNLQSYGANQGANCFRTRDGRVLVRYEPEHNPPQKQYPQTTPNSNITSTAIIGGTLAGLVVLLFVL